MRIYINIKNLNFTKFLRLCLRFFRLYLTQKHIPLFEKLKHVHKVEVFLHQTVKQLMHMSVFVVYYCINSKSVEL